MQGRRPGLGSGPAPARFGRTKDLRKRKVLLGSHAEVSFHALGLTLEARCCLCVLAKPKREAVDKFLRENLCRPRSKKRVSAGRPENPILLQE
jgi:hypothetical protein